MMKTISLILILGAVLLVIWSVMGFELSMFEKATTLARANGNQPKKTGNCSCKAHSNDNIPIGSSTKINQQVRRPLLMSPNMYM